MYPLIFKFWFIEARSYYLLWAFALLLFVFWTRHRAVKNYFMDYDKVSSVILWVYCAAIIGAIIGNALEKLPFVFSGSASAGELLGGGLSSGPGMLCGGLAGIYRLRRLGMPLFSFADSAAVPAAGMIAIGRNGCFLEGCCLGTGVFAPVRPWWGAHFPADPQGFYRYPSQLSEAAAALLIMIILLCIEKFFRNNTRHRKHGAILFPVFILLFGLYRFIFDSLRELLPGHAFFSGHILSVAAIALGCLWLFHTYKKPL